FRADSCRFAIDQLIRKPRKLGPDPAMGCYVRSGRFAVDSICMDTRGARFGERLEIASGNSLK
ncbi:MAG TPA: hypothetical protein VIL63_12430, partial [Terriglobales bacterium]